MNLEEEFQRIKQNHRRAIIARVARICFSGSTGRVFPEKARATSRIKTVLQGINVDDLPTIDSQDAFKKWFEKQLGAVAAIIPDVTSKREKLTDGARRWGYGTKILSLYLRDIVEHCRYFTPDQAEKARKWLYAPIDGIVMKRMRECGVSLAFSKIMEIDSSNKFYDMQDRLGEAAEAVGVPRVWFDDNWGDRQW